MTSTWLLLDKILKFTTDYLWLLTFWWPKVLSKKWKKLWLPLKQSAEISNDCLPVAFKQCLTVERNIIFDFFYCSLKEYRSKKMILLLIYFSNNELYIYFLASLYDLHCLHRVSYNCSRKKLNWLLRCQWCSDLCLIF